VVCYLLLERVEDAVDEALLHLGINVGAAEVLDDLFDRLHDHLAVDLGLVLEVVDDAVDNLGHADLVGQFDRGFDQLLVVALVQGHAAHPKVLEKLWQDLVTDVLCGNTLCGRALLDDLFIIVDKI